MLKHSFLPSWRRMGRLGRLATELLLLAVIAGASLLLFLRYKVLPEIERYRVQIVAAASAAAGQPLSIGKIAADWDGLRPRLSFTDVQVLDAEGRVALSLPRVENTVAWTSLPMFELRFHSLTIERPDLTVRRDTQGKLYVAGVTLDPATASQGNPDWLLNQSRVVIRGGRITWQDESRAAPPLVLEQVDLHVENLGRHHRFAIAALPPGQLASRLDLRGNFYGASLADMKGWDGELYTQFDYVDVPSWKPWVDMPPAFRRGKGALRMWLGFEQGRLRSADADVALAGVRARLGEKLPPLDLSELRGRIGWLDLGRGFQVSSRGLALKMRDGFSLAPTDFYLRLAGDPGTANASGEVRLNNFALSDLGVLASYLPIAEGIKTQIAETAPQGRVSEVHASWRVRANGSLRYEVKGRLEQVSLRRVGDRPGFSRLSGEVEGDDGSGWLKLDSRKFGLDAPQLFAGPVEFDTFTARLGWQRNSRGLEFKLNEVVLVNAELAGTVRGSFQMEEEGPGSIDASVDMRRVAVRSTGRYTPLPSVNHETHAWLQAALQGGQADRFSVRLRGNLRDFPFVDSKKGLFRLEARASGVLMEFDRDWPRLEDARVNLLIQGNKLDIRAASAKTADAQLQNIHVSIPDLLADKLLLQVRGEASGPTQQCLGYIASSPVNGYLDGFTEGVGARGNGKLNLQLDIPLDGDDPVRVRGDYRFFDNEIDFGNGVPLLRKTNGVLLFTESTVHAGDITAQILGGDAHLTVQTDKGALLTSVKGRADLDNLDRLAPHPILNRLHGSTDWDADIRVAGRQIDVSVNSDLYGIASTLPAPLSKLPVERMALHFEQKTQDARHRSQGFHYGRLVDASLMQVRDDTGSWHYRGGYIALGGDRMQGGRDGIRVAGSLPHLAVEGWGGLGLDSAEAGMLPNIAGVDVEVEKLTGFGSRINGLEIRGSGRNGLLSLRLASRELNGDLIWQPQGNGKLFARLQNAMLAEGAAEPATAAEPAGSERHAESAFPDVDVAVERLSYKGRQLGRLELEMSGTGGDVLLERMEITNPDGKVSMSGKWQAEPELTSMDLRIDITDAGKILSRSGYPDSLKDGSGTLESSLRWAGAPESFSYNKLNGQLKLTVGKGRFLKVDPGAAKLLGVMSLQSIPRRISLDFTDVLSGGFQFDSITGNARIVNGLLMSEDMQLIGSAARVTMRGEVDLMRETQELKVRILPTIGDNVSILSFAAGPAVGMGVLLANKILRDPLDKLVSFEYNVSGSWADPRVEKVAQPKPVQIEETP